MYVAGIDVGNYDTKTQNTSIPSGYTGPLSEKPIGDEYLKFNGKYYVPSFERFAYEKDKTRTERCIILSLFALANEIYDTVVKSNKNVEKTRENTQKLINRINEIGIGVGVPPTHYTSTRIAELCDYYKKYLGDGAKFEWNGYEFNVKLVAIKVYPQGGAGASDEENAFRKEYPDGYYVIDIGGYTVDTLKYGKGGKLDGKWSSKEMGVITLYDRIISRMQADHNVSLDFGGIEAVIRGGKTPLTITCPEAVETIKEMVQDYANNIIDTQRQLGLEFKAYPCLFMGGGSLLLKPYILKNELIYPDITIFLSSPNANARGYARFLKLETSERR